MNTTMAVAATVASYFVFSAAVGAMSPPTKEQESGVYGWFYRFAQRLAANADRVFESRFPSIAAEPKNPIDARSK